MKKFPDNDHDCQHIMRRGPDKGTECIKESVKDAEYCIDHVKIYYCSVRNDEGKLCKNPPRKVDGARKYCSDCELLMEERSAKQRRHVERLVELFNRDI